MRFMKSYPHLRSVLRLTILVWLLVALLIGIAPATAQTISLSEDARLARWNPDSDAIAIITWEYRLWIWSDTGTYLIAEGFYDDVTWSPDGQQIALLKRRGAVVVVADIEIWQVSDPANPVFIRRFEVEGFPDESPYEVHWQPDGDLVAVTGTGVRLHDTNTGNLVRTIPVPGIVIDIDWSPDGTKIVAEANERIQVWEIATATLQEEYQLSGVVLVEWSDDGRYLGADQNLSIERSLHQIYLVDLSIPNASQVFTAHDNTIRLLDWESGSIVVYKSVLRQVEVWDVSTQQLLMTVPVQDFFFPRLSPNGARIVYKNAQGTLEVITIPDHTPD